MQVKIGEKIKELRKRDGRKQEDLAGALGVTAQAVSRWESGACYPDVSLIPAIANYFHVAIDTLFGYSNDRESKIKEYAKAADRFFLESNGDPSEIIDLLRKGLEEFPAEPELQSRLANALFQKGFNAYDRKPNPYLEEAATLFEQLAKGNPLYVASLVHVYNQMGQYDKAENKANSQPSIGQSRELLLANVFDDKIDMHRGNAILALLHEFGFFTNNSIKGNDALRSSQEGIDILSTLILLYERIFGGNCFGVFHSDLCMLDLTRTNIAVRLKDYTQARTYWESAFDHLAEYKKLQTDSLNGIPKKMHFESPLLRDAEPNASVVVCYPEYLKTALGDFPKKLQTQIMKDPRFAELFA